MRKKRAFPEVNIASTAGQLLKRKADLEESILHDQLTIGNLKGELAKDSEDDLGLRRGFIIRRIASVEARILESRQALETLREVGRAIKQSSLSVTGDG